MGAELLRTISSRMLGDCTLAYQEEPICKCTFQELIDYIIEGANRRMYTIYPNTEGELFGRGDEMMEYQNGAIISNTISSESLTKYVTHVSVNSSPASATYCVFLGEE